MIPILYRIYSIFAAISVKIPKIYLNIATYGTFFIWTRQLWPNFYFSLTVARQCVSVVTEIVPEIHTDKNKQNRLKGMFVITIDVIVQCKYVRRRSLRYQLDARVDKKFLWERGRMIFRRYSHFNRLSGDDAKQCPSGKRNLSTHFKKSCIQSKKKEKEKR